MAHGYNIGELVGELDRALDDLETSRLRGSNFAPQRLDGARSVARRALEQVVTQQSELPPGAPEGESLAHAGRDLAFVLTALEDTVRAPAHAVANLLEARERVASLQQVVTAS